MTIAEKLLKTVMWLGLAMAGLIIVITLVVLGINWHDQAPSEAATRLMKLSSSRPSIADKDNAYVYLMGFSVEPAQDPLAWGSKRITWAQEQLKKSPDAFLDPKDLPGKDHDFKAQRSRELQTLIATCHKTVDAKCLQALGNGEKTIAAWLASEQWLLERYKTLLAHPAWSETLPTLPFGGNTPLPPYQNAFEGQKLLLAQAWQLAGQGNAAGVRKLLAEDMRFWRQGLVSSNMLIGKMIAVGALKRHFTWANLILRRLPPAVMAQGIPAQWRTPLSDSERAMLRSLAGELAVANSLLKQTKESKSSALDMAGTAGVLSRLSDPIFQSLLQPQDASNKYAEQLVSSDAALQVPYEQYPAAVERARAVWNQKRDDALLTFFAKRIYNPTGEYLLSIGSWDPTEYAVRISDLEGLRRLTLVTTELRSQGVSNGQLAQKLAEAPAHNPYTGQPFVWDDSAKAVVFTGLEKGERGRHALMY